MKRRLVLAIAVPYLVLGLATLCSVAAFGQSSKARTFNGTSDNLQSSAPINLSAASTISISFWGWFDSDAKVQMFLETSAAADSNVGAFAIDQQNGGVVHVFVAGTSTNPCEWTFPDPSSGAWHHYLIVHNITACTTGMKVYVDGISQSLTNLQPSNGTTFGNFTLNVMARNAASLFLPGRISDIAIWTTGLTSGNATTLAACGNPQTVNGTPAFYWPINQTSPEVATDGGVNLNVTGTTNSASNCMGGGTAVSQRLTLTGVGR